MSPRDRQEDVIATLLREACEIDAGPPRMTIVRIGYEVAGVPHFLEISSSRAVDAQALRLWFQTGLGRPDADLRIIETEEITLGRVGPCG